MNDVVKDGPFHRSFIVSSLSLSYSTYANIRISLELFLMFAVYGDGLLTNSYVRQRGALFVASSKLPHLIVRDGACNANGTSERVRDKRTDLSFDDARMQFLTTIKR